MKRLAAKYFLFVSTVGFALAVGGWPQNINAQTPPAPAATDTSVVPATPVVPPPNIVPGSPYAEVVRLTQAGVDQSIITTYVTEFHQPVQSGFGQNHLSYQPWRAEHAGDGDDAARPAIAAAIRRHASRATGAADCRPRQPHPAPETTPSNVTDVTPPPAPDQPVTVNYFYNSLAPYGSWVVVGGYGRCWRPTVCVYNSGWQPYCDNGHWVYTDCGWYWASELCVGRDVPLRTLVPRCELRLVLVSRHRLGAVVGDVALFE